MRNPTATLLQPFSLYMQPTIYAYLTYLFATATFCNPDATIVQPFYYPLQPNATFSLKDATTVQLFG